MEEGHQKVSGAQRLRKPVFVPAARRDRAEIGGRL